MATHTDLIVSGYIREAQQKLDVHIPIDIWMVFIMFYQRCIQFGGNTINLTSNEKELITSWFIDIFDLQQKSPTLTSTLLYDHNKDGKKGQNFHQKCDGNINTFTIVETEFNGHTFGCFFSKELKSENRAGGNWIHDGKAFLCVIRSCFHDKGPELFKDETKVNTYFNADTWGPAFNSASLRLLTHSGSSCSYGDGINGNSLCGGTEYNEEKTRYSFKIKEMNTFTINIYDH